MFFAVAEFFDVVDSNGRRERSFNTDRRTDKINAKLFFFCVLWALQRVPSFATIRPAANSRKIHQQELYLASRP